MPKSFSVDNPGALEEQIRALEEGLSESTLRKTGAAMATEFKNEVALRVPKDTGDLATGLTVFYDKEDSVTGKIATYVVAFVGDTAARGPKNRKVSRRALAGWLENGRSKMAAKPFVTPAYEAARQRAAEVAQEKLLEAVAKKP
ncbi:hypothetical protein [Robbsia andropogonis]|uniref:hypothetical protein n=1 Tax=Robbsia andropogonis TaxID=28092 RepID=UPI002A6B4198|nr:hypothetical protein [Robbsia andropogonis]